jgi:hypothetical protein
MFRGARHVFFIFIALLCCAHGDTVITTNEKRHGGVASDYQMCLDSFDIHRDKIIKTQDSRDMGAKYLSVLDMDSRLDCLKYCCETERCDVFIFEEKVRESPHVKHVRNPNINIICECRYMRNMKPPQNA